MTSSRLFFRVMKEDMRHKVWMAALSALGSFIAMPVTWLLLTASKGSAAGMYGREEYLTKVYIMRSASVSVFGFCGLVCIMMALITGLLGFRYVFRSDMVDTYHSLPVKRSTLYGACYLNGLLIWFLPFIVCLIPFFAMMISFANRFERTLNTLTPGVETGMYQYIEAPLWTMLVKDIVLKVAILAVVYLLVYHVALTAVMLSGNMLNAMVSMVIMGFGVVGIRSLIDFFPYIYLQTFYQSAKDLTLGAIYASPLFSALWLLYGHLADSGTLEMWTVVLVNVGVAVLLGICAYMLYRRRASEMAEQGIANKAVAALMRIAASMCAGIFGWILVTATLDGSPAGLQHGLWGSFGAVLAAGLMAGILNTVFQMDFGAFFTHKWQMAAGIVLSLLFCGTFYGDWFGYDTYLPEKGEIAQIAVNDWNLTSKSFFVQEEFLLENMSFQDRDVIYAWLERMAAGAADPGVGDYVNVKVTLKNGSCYYRNYKVTQKDKDLLWPILTSEEYMKYAYFIDEELVDEDTVEINVMGRQNYLRTADELESFRHILRAYNQDVLEHPESVMQGGGRILAIIQFYVRVAREDEYVAYQGKAELVIYEGMEASVEALREEGFGEQMDGWEASEVMEIVMRLGYGASEYETSEEIIARAREIYGVPAADQETAEETVRHDKYSEAGYPTEVRVTDPREVAELLGLLTPVRPTHTSSLFQKSYITVEVIDRMGNAGQWYIQEGTLPEKYILRFGEP